MKLGPALLLWGRLVLAQGAPGSTIAWPTLDGRVPALPRIVVSDPPTLRIGTASGPDYTLLNGVAGAVRLSDGGLVIGDAGNNRILFFDAAGRWLRSVGRKGDGPGEFREPQWLGRCGADRVAFHDGGHARLSLFTTRGELARTISLPVGLNFDQVLWCSGDGGRLLILMNRPHGTGRRGIYGDVPVALLRTEDSGLDTVFRAGTRRFYFGARVMALMPVPLDRDVPAAAGARLLYLCRNVEARCEVLDTTGARLRQISIGLATRPVRPEDWEAAFPQQFLGVPSRWYRTAARQLFLEITPRQQFPLIDQVRTDAADNLWVRTYDGYTTAFATWLVLSPTGQPLGMVAVPRGLFLLDIGPDYLLGFTRDEDAVERVELYRVPQLRSVVR